MICQIEKNVFNRVCHQVLPGFFNIFLPCITFLYGVFENQIPDCGFWWQSLGRISIRQIKRIIRRLKTRLKRLKKGLNFRGSKTRVHLDWFANFVGP